MTSSTDSEAAVLNFFHYKNRQELRYLNIVKQSKFRAWDA